MKVLPLVVFLSVITGLFGNEKDFPAGGFSVDFKDNTSITAESFGKNLLYNPSLQSNDSTAARPEGWGLNFTPRNSAKFVPQHPGRLETLPGNRHCAFLQELPAPDDTDERVLELKFDYRGDGEKVVGALYVQDVSGKDLKLSGKSFSGKPQKNFRSARVIFRLPPAGKKMRVALRLYNGKYVEFANVSLRQMYSKRPAVDAVLFPFAYLDNTYCIGENSIGQLNFLLRASNGTALTRGNLFLQLPPGVEVLDVAQPCRWDKSGKFVTVAAGTVKIMLLNRQLKAGQQATFSYYYSDGKLKSPERQAILRVMPLPDVPQSKYFRSGVMAPEIMNFSESKVLPYWIDLLQKTGINSVCHGMTMAHKVTGKLSVPASAQAIKNYHDHNIEVTAHSGALADGYRLCGGKVPEDLLFMGKNGPVKEGRYDLICPEVILNKNPFVMDILKRHKDLLAATGMDAFEPNWEPFIFERKGCFCDRCLSAFEKLTRQPRSHAADDNPAWINFRSQQHGRIVKLVTETLGRDAFIPTIDAKELNGTNPAFYAPSSYKDYAGELSRMVLWSPYIHYRFFSAYSYSPDMLLPVDHAARAVQIPEKHYAYPNCVQVTTWMAEPETLSFQYLIYFFNRWHGASAYTFPGGLDLRWVHALADANKVIVQTEELLHKAKPLPPLKLKNITPIPDRQLLKNYRFALSDGTELLAVGNFWPRGECFFELPELPSDKVFVDVMLNKCYQSNITQVGALKFRVLRIMDKNSASKYKQVITEEFMQELVQSRQAAINQAFEQENILRNRDMITNNISAKEVKTANSSASFAQGKLSAVMPWGKISISADKGGMIEELTEQGNLLLAPGAISGFAHLGRNRSHLTVNKRFFCTRLEYKNNALEADFARKLQVDEHVQFNGLILTLQYRIALDKMKINYTVTLENSSDGVRGPFALMQKYFFLPQSWQFGPKVLTRRDYETLIKDIPSQVVMLDGSQKSIARLSWDKTPAMLNFWNVPGAAKPCVEFAEHARELRPAEKISFSYTIGK